MMKTRFWNFLFIYEILILQQTKTNNINEQIDKYFSFFYSYVHLILNHM